MNIGANLVGKKRKIFRKNNQNAGMLFTNNNYLCNTSSCRQRDGYGEGGISLIIGVLSIISPNEKLALLFLREMMQQKLHAIVI